MTAAGEREDYVSRVSEEAMTQEAHKWTCEFCHEQLEAEVLPDTWDWVWQSAVCPLCRERVKADGGYQVVLAGAYAGDRPDPRDRELQPAVDEAERIMEPRA